MTANSLDLEYAELRRSLTEYLSTGGRLAVVKAPPGSGKTHTLIEVLTNLVGEGQRIAVAAQTNSQADDICARWAITHAAIPVTRFSSSGHSPAHDLPSAVRWVTDKASLSGEPGITVATAAKWSLTDLSHPYDLLAIDEAWQMAWADLMQCALVSDRFLMIGDPGQIPPVVTVDVRRWETSPRAPHEAAPEVVLAEASLITERFVGSLPACRRLPHESVDFVRPFYDFEFESYVAAGDRGLETSAVFGHSLASGRPLALTIPTPAYGPPIEVDQELAESTADVVRRLMESESHIRMGQTRTKLSPEHVGVTSSHRVMNSALAAALGSLATSIRVDTPERWQGLERPVMIALHPLSGVSEPSAFDLETGRLCVMASRHQAALIVMTRDHVGDTLRNFVPSAEQAPGRPDVVGRGHDAHLKFWGKLEDRGGVQSLT